ELGIKKGIGTFGDWDWKNFSVEDMARGMMTFENGASLILETSFAANMEKHEELSVALMGDKGGADVFPLKIFQEKYETLIDTTLSYIFAGNRNHFHIKYIVVIILKDYVEECNMNVWVKMLSNINRFNDTAGKKVTIYLR